MAQTVDRRAGSLSDPTPTAAINIHEVFHPASAAVRRTSPFVSARTAIATFLAAGFLVAGVSRLCNFAVVDALVIFAFLGLPLLLAAVYSRAAQVRQSKERTISLAGDLVTFTTTDDSEVSPLPRCCWFFGKVTDDPNLSYQDIRQKAILLVFPSGRTIACGLTAPLYSEWLNALHSSRCRKVLRQEGALGVLLSVLFIVGLVGGASLGWSVGEALRDAVIQAPQNNQFGNFLPGLLLILGAWLGAVSPCFIPGWRRYTDLERQQFTRFAVHLPAKLAIPVGAIVGGNLATGLLLMALFAALLVALTQVVYRAPRSI